MVKSFVGWKGCLGEKTSVWTADYSTIVLSVALEGSRGKVIIA